MSDASDPDRAAILARRRRWIALAVAGAASSTLASCTACLAPTVDTGRSPDASPVGDDGGAADAGTTDAGSDGGP
jgi:hypothetical protein